MKGIKYTLFLSLRAFLWLDRLSHMQKTTSEHAYGVIKYELHDYKVDESDLSAECVAPRIGMPPMQVFKALVSCGDKTGVMIVVCIPDTAELKFKTLAGVSANKK